MGDATPVEPGFVFGAPLTFLIFFEGIVVRVDDIVRMDEMRDLVDANKQPAGTQTKVFTKHAGYFFTAEPLDGIIERMAAAYQMETS